MQSWVSLGGKESHTNIQISAETGSNWGPCGRKADILHLRQPCPTCSFKYEVCFHRYSLVFCVVLWTEWHVLHSTVLRWWNATSLTFLFKDYSPKHQFYYEFFFFTTVYPITFLKQSRFMTDFWISNDIEQIKDFFSLRFRRWFPKLTSK